MLHPSVIEAGGAFEGHCAMKDKLIFAAEVAVVFIVIAAFQKHVMAIPAVGAYLPKAQ